MEKPQFDFKTIKLFRGRVGILLPGDFKDMPDYIAKRKYPAKSRPPVIMMSQDTLVNYTFNLLEHPLPKSELYEATKGLYTNLKRYQPLGHYDEIRLSERKDGQVAWFSYDSQAMDAELFNIVYVTDIEGKLMYGSFNCLLEDKEAWKEKALYSIESIQEIGGQ